MSLFRSLLPALAVLLASTSACAQDAALRPMVVAAEPDAVQAGLNVLERGGTAIDAAVAIQATLGLVEPQSSGIGGGAFMLYYDAASGTVTAYNGREAAPGSAGTDRFLTPDGKTLRWPDAVTSGRSSGVPGVMAMLDIAHQQHGRLPWETLFDDPIRLAETGFVISFRLGRNLEGRAFAQKETHDFRAYFSDGRGGLKKTGDTHTNRAYADTLRQIAAHRSEAFRRGPLAEALLNSVNAAPLPADMTPRDLKAYQALISPPVCVSYRIVWRVCTPPAPSGGVSLLEALKIVEQFPLDQWGQGDPRSWAVILEAERIMYADRDQYMADPDFVSVPSEGLLEAEYIKGRAALITVGTPAPPPAYGVPRGAPVWGAATSPEPGGTTHFVVMDRYGNAVSVTSTVESSFGSGRMAGGFFLNNQLTDFSFIPTTKDGTPAANRVEGGKRPRSAMAPVMIFDQEGHLVALVGSPGGPSILSYNLKTVVAHLDFGMDMQAAIDLPHIIARGNSIRVERGRMTPSLLQELKDMGYSLTEVEGEESGLNGLSRIYDGAWSGGSDPRRNGIVGVGR